MAQPLRSAAVLWRPEDRSPAEPGASLCTSTLPESPLLEYVLLPQVHASHLFGQAQICFAPPSRSLLYAHQHLLMFLI